MIEIGGTEELRRQIRQRMMLIAADELHRRMHYGAPVPKIIPPADLGDVLHDQLDALLAATEKCGERCLCRECRRLNVVKGELLRVFTETKGAGS